jgi:hypothetical protein
MPMKTEEASNAHHLFVVWTDGYSRRFMSPRTGLVPYLTYLDTHDPNLD